MDLTDTQTTVMVVSILLLVVGVVGILVPILPGLLLCWLGVLVYALFGGDGWRGWVIFGLATAVALGGTIVKYAWPGRNLKRSGVPTRSLVFGGLLGIVGFFVIPVAGVVIGFILGLFIAERIRLGEVRLAWPSTKQALKAVGLSMLVELGAALLIVVLYVAGLIWG